MARLIFGAMTEQDEPYPLIIFNTEGATAADYIYFLSDVIKKLEEQTDALERDANSIGRTLMHDFMGGRGSVPLNSKSLPRDPE